MVKLILFNRLAMPKYYVNTNRQSGSGYNHEVHKEGCLWMPSEWNRQYLGWFSSDEEALKAAKRYYADADGCVHCCPSIHKG